jgi:hypothetical protein
LTLLPEAAHNSPQPPSSYAHVYNCMRRETCSCVRNTIKNRNVSIVICYNSYYNLRKTLKTYFI